MTDGERMIWAAAFALALDDGDVGHAASMARSRVEQARRRLQAWRERGAVGPDVAMLAAMLEGES